MDLACPDFDMCSACADKKTHNPDHPLLKLTKPMPRGGFCMGRDKLPGAAEMFTPPWMRHKRRAMKKWFKAQKKHGGEQQETMEEGSTPFDGPPRQRRHCGRGGRGGRGGRCGRGGGNPFRRWFFERFSQP